jgi:aldehyde dehydrogenase (NAD+)
MANVVELPIPKSNSKIPVQTGLFINNEFVPSVDNLDPIRSTPY